MSDTTKEALNNAEPSQDAVQPNVSETSEPTPAPTETKADEEMISKAKFDELVTKARQEEKQKLYKAMEKAKADAEALEAQKKAVHDQLNEAQERLKQTEETQMSEMNSIKETLEALKAQNEMLQKRLDEVAVEADSKVKQSELNAYKKQRLEQENIMLTELVAGSSVEEIEAAIKAVKDREDNMRKSLEEKVRAELSKDLPRPISTDTDTSSVAPMSDRYKMSKLNPSDYQSMRQQMMQKALESMRR